MDAGVKFPGETNVWTPLNTTVALLLMAWVQVSGLMLARTADRLKELAVRATNGASTSRLVSLFAADAMWLSLGSLALAWASVPSLTALLISWLPTSVRFGQYLQADWRTLAFAGVATVLGSPRCHCSYRG